MRYTEDMVPDWLCESQRTIRINHKEDGENMMFAAPIEDEEEIMNRILERYEESSIGAFFADEDDDDLDDEFDDEDDEFDDDDEDDEFDDDYDDLDDEDDEFDDDYDDLDDEDDEFDDDDEDDDW